MSVDQVLEARAEACYEAYCSESGDLTSPDWSRLAPAEREVWRRVVETAWGRR